MKASLLPVIRDDDEFPALLDSVQTHFRATSGPHFTTDAENLFALFLAALPEHLRQTYTCHACRRFMESFGGLVTLDESGVASPAIWPAEAPSPFGPAVAAVVRAVRSAKVTGVFLSSATEWGQPVTGYWSHLSVAPSPASVYRATPLKTAGQAMAEKSEERAMLLRGLAEYPREVIAAALPLLESDSLYRSEKCLGVAKWLLALHDARNATKRKDHRENVVWRAVALAPPGWAHVKTTMISTLLDDIVAGLDFAVISRRFAEKMHPLQYLRPQAAPSAGVLAQAEKVVAALASAGSLERRYARLDEIEKLWEPKVATPEVKPTGGVFAHLQPKGAAPAIAQPDPPAVTITWEKFAREVLPKAERIEYRVPYSGPFVALLTAVNDDAPPIIQWDSEERRNPVSWYVYSGGSVASGWGLRSGEWAEVTAVTLFPHLWDGAERHTQHGKGAIFLLADCMDTHARSSSSGLFPEILRAEYHGIRSAIEAYSRSRPPSGREQGNACGVDLRAWGQAFRVTTATGRLSYRIDRWD
jgi:hypothetical protein